MSPTTVTPGHVPTWPGMGGAGRVVAAFLAQVRVTGDDAAAERLMAATVPAHQLVADDPHTVVRTPAEYAEHVRDLLADQGPVRFEVTEAIEQDDRVHVRFRQLGRVLELGSVDYRVERGRIAEYWIQLDHSTPREASPPGLVREPTTPPPQRT